MTLPNPIDEALNTFLSKVYSDSVENGVMKAVVKREVFEELRRSLREQMKKTLLELVGELNNNDWRKPINSDELRQKIDTLWLTQSSKDNRS